MGYPLPANSPKVTVNGRTFAVAAFDFQTPIGCMFKIGVFELVGNEWQQCMAEDSDITTYANPNDVLLDVQAKGGSVKYIQWLIEQVNSFFKRLFSQVAPPTGGEPTTDGEARAMITAELGKLKFSLLDGIPNLGQ